MSKITIIGTGYVGLTTGACLASLGHDVVCVDSNIEKVHELSAGHVAIHENGLQDLVRTGLTVRNLSFVVDAEAAVRSSEFIFFCLPTPESDDGSVDISIVVRVSKEISSHLQPFSIIVNKSTLPVGSVKIVEESVLREDVYVVSNPEFLREGSAVSDFLKPDRIVIGSTSKLASQRVADIYSSIPTRILITDPTSAETIKYASNAILAARLSFVNSLASICEVVGANTSDVMEGLGTDSRIGSQFLRPGPGWGGSCFPKDTKGLLNFANQRGFDFELLAEVISANESQLDRTASRIMSEARLASDRPTVAIWGLTFKSGTNDLRESPSLKIINRLIDGGARIQAFDPTQIDSRASFSFPTSNTAIAACKNAHCLAVLTEWNDFTTIDPRLIADQMRNLSVFDGRNILNRARWERAGFRFKGVGYR